MSHVLRKIAARLGLMAVTLIVGSAVHAQPTCVDSAQLLVVDDRREWTPCNSFGALYIHNNIEKIDIAGHPPPEGPDLIGLAVQAFVYRRDNLDQKGMVDHLISALPLLNQLDDERFAIYSSYIVFNYGMHTARGQDYTDTLNSAIGMSGKQTRFARPNDIVCFVEMDVLTLPVDEVVRSPRYEQTCGADR